MHLSIKHTTILDDYHLYCCTSKPHWRNNMRKLPEWTLEILFVAVHSSRQVKITDFGLAKLLDDQHESYQSTGGKVE